MAAALVVAACGPARQEVDTEAGAGTPAELGATLNVRVAGDTAWLDLHVTNVTGGALTLEFGSTQRYDFEVQDGGGAVVWRWSDEMMFAQVLGAERLEAGESLSYGVSWVAERAGEYNARGMLVSHNYPVDLRTPFRVGAE